MSKFAKIASASLAVAVLAGSVLTSVATAAPVAPAESRLVVSSKGCPAAFTLRARVITEDEGHVQIRFQRDDGLTSAPLWVQSSKQPNRLTFAIYKFTLPPAPALVNAKYRVLATGVGVTKVSKWSYLRTNC